MQTKQQWLGCLLCGCCVFAAQAAGYSVQTWPSGKPAPALQASDLQGRTWRLADLRGKVVLVNFWASWCEPCRAEMPSLQHLAQTHADCLLVLTVNFKEAPAVALRFAQRMGLGLPVLPDLQGGMARAWGVKVFPSTVVLGSDGRVRAILQGELDWAGEEAHQLLKPLLPQPAS